jgi:beta-glucosidase
MAFKVKEWARASKHFVCNECETMRKMYSVSVDDRALREIYMAPFQWVVREAKLIAMMTAWVSLFRENVF